MCKVLLLMTSLLFMSAAAVKFIPGLPALTNDSSWTESNDLFDTKIDSILEKFTHREGRYLPDVTTTMSMRVLLLTHVANLKLDKGFVLAIEGVERVEDVLMKMTDLSEHHFLARVFIKRVQVRYNFHLTYKLAPLLRINGQAVATVHDLVVKSNATSHLDLINTLFSINVSTVDIEQLGYIDISLQPPNILHKIGSRSINVFVNTLKGLVLDVLKDFAVPYANELLEVINYEDFVKIMELR